MKRFNFKAVLLSAVAVVGALLLAQAVSVVLRIGNQSVTFNRLPLSVVTFTPGSGSAVDATDTITFPVVISTNRRPPAGVQFDLIYTPATITSISAVAGPVATAAGKSIQCSAPPGTTGTFRCLVFGVNQGTIGNGDVADITVVVTQSTSVAITNLVASTPNGSALGVAAGPANTLAAFVGVTALTCVTPPYDSGLPVGTYNLEPGETIACTATIGQPAPAAGFSSPVSLSSSGVTAPASIAIPAGGTSVGFTVTGQ